MKPFVFTLRRIYNYKEQALGREKNILSALHKKRDDIEQQITTLETYRLLKSQELLRKTQQGMSTTELSSYKFFSGNTQRQLESLHTELIRANAAVERQLQVVVAASQELSGLDKLEEKQKEDYQIQTAKENELQISEYLAMSLTRPR